jgi:hypothetical protein
MIVKYNNLGNGLAAAFPEFKWELEKFSHRGKKSMQKWYGRGGEGRGEERRGEERRGGRG